MGPTAVGKTSLALTLAKQLPVEIISVDSAMVYRGLNIGTGKPSPEILGTIPHHLIDICEPEQPFSAHDFIEQALCCIKKIHEKNKTPLLVGGTMMYFKALLAGLSDLPEACEKTRAQINEEANNMGWQTMHEKLRALDPETAERIHPHDPQRISRALEIIFLTNEKVSTLYRKNKKKRIHFPYKTLQLALMPETRPILHEQIALRFQDMLAQGFVEEVQQFYEQQKYQPQGKDLPAFRAVGYRQAWAYLDGEYDQKTMSEKAISATRQLAKRQLTWLRSWSNLIEIKSQNSYNLLGYCEHFLEK